VQQKWHGHAKNHGTGLDSWHGLVEQAAVATDVRVGEETRLVCGCFIVCQFQLNLHIGSQVKKLLSVGCSESFIQQLKPISVGYSQAVKTNQCWLQSSS
jgi:hypothetical protein